MMKACSIAMRQFPNVNAVMDEERFELVVKGDHNFGISCDTPNGLYVPVIKNVEQKSILHIAAEMADLVEVAAVRIKGGKVKDRWSTFVNPGRPIFGNQMHGITDKG